jgi:hypothetical protein
LVFKSRDIFFHGYPNSLYHKIPDDELVELVIGAGFCQPTFSQGGQGGKVMEKNHCF